MPNGRLTYLREAVVSVLNQSYKNWELIIKTNQEKDVFDALQDLDLSKVIIIFNKDRGITDALNQALRFSTGDMFMWANDDDLLHPMALSHITSALSRDKWGFGKMSLSTGGERGVDCDIKSLKNGNCICQPTVFWTREAYNEVGPFNENLDLVSDYDYWVRLMKHYKPKFIPKIMATYRLHPDQLTNKASSEQNRQAQIVRNNI